MRRFRLSAAPRGLFLISIVVLSTLLARPAAAQVSSTFDSDREGWALEGDGHMDWDGSAGVSGGGLFIVDHVSGSSMNVKAPAKFLGDWTGLTVADHLSVEIYMHRVNEGDGLIGAGTVFRISGPGGTATAIDLGDHPPSNDSWRTYSVPIDSASWNVGGSWTELLNDVRSLKICVEYIDGAEENKVDNVVLSATPLYVYRPCAVSDFNDCTTGEWSFEDVSSHVITPTGGNGGCWLEIGDELGVNGYIYPPAYYLGDWSALWEAGYITIDMRVVTPGLTCAGSPDFITISGPGGSAHVELSVDDIPTDRRLWRTYKFPLALNKWNLDSGNWISLLSWVDECKIDVEYFNGVEVIGIDNFGRVAETCPPIDEPVAADLTDVTLCDRYSLLGVFGVAYNPIDGQVHSVVNQTPSAGGGVYPVTGPDAGLLTQAYDRPTHLIFGPAGNAFITEVFSGMIYRLGEGGSVGWISGMHEGDDDPAGMCIVPAGWGDTIAVAGDILVADVGSNGPDEVWGFSPYVQASEYLVLPDWGEVDWVDLAAAPNEVYLCDALFADHLFRILPNSGGMLEGLAISEYLPAMCSIAYDEVDSRLYVAEGNGMTVWRVDPSNGFAEQVAHGFADINVGCLDIDVDGRRLFVADTGYNRVYEFCLSGTSSGIEPTLTSAGPLSVKVSPNPFNPFTTLSFTLPVATRVTAEVYSVSGAKVRVIVHEQHFGEGDNRIAWDGRDDKGARAASGVYFFRVTTKSGTQVARGVLLK